MDNNFYNDIDKLDKKTLDAARRGDTKAVLSSLNDKDRKKIQDMLDDKEKLKRLLSSPAAQKLIEIFGGKQNG